MIVPFRDAEDRAREAPRVAEHLRLGGLIAYPTETVYGLGSGLDAAALDRLASLKGRAEAKPFLLLVAGPEQVAGLRWTEAALRLADAFWPGPLTLVLPAEGVRYPDRVVGPGGAVAVRSSPHPAVRAILEAYGAPITSTSANLPGNPPAASREEALGVLEALGDPGDLWLLDGGTLPPSAPSTIVDCTTTSPRVQRAGAVPLAALRTVVEGIDG